MNRSPATVLHEMIAHWSSRREFARRLGVPYNTLSAWIYRDSIPLRFWDDLVDLATGVGYALTRPQLREMHTRQPVNRGETYGRPQHPR